MAHVHVPRSLVALFPGVPRRVEVEAPDIVALIRELDRRYPGMWDRLCEPGPRLRPHIKVFVDRRPATLATALEAGSVVHIIPAVSGGDTPAWGPDPSGRPYSGAMTFEGWGGLHYLEQRSRGAVGCFPGCDLGPAIKAIDLAARDGALRDPARTLDPHESRTVDTLLDELAALGVPGF